MTTPWTEELSVRPEVVGAGGSVGDLQMSLHRAAYEPEAVPYSRVEYYADITEPTANLLGLFRRAARTLSGQAEDAPLVHLDQGMGGGKSHALVGLYHLANDPAGFFHTPLGKRIEEISGLTDAERTIGRPRVVVLTADHFSPGRISPTYGPATDLFGRFLWRLFDGDPEKYTAYLAMGANKDSLRRALQEVAGPILILLDELMDYAMQLSDASTITSMPGEQAFLNALMDACDDVAKVVFVVVMISSEQDQKGYPSAAAEFRDYVARRLQRNGRSVAVTESTNFAAIIRRRIFEASHAPFPVDAIVDGYRSVLDQDPAWDERCLALLGHGRGLAGLGDRIAKSYPFHPDLMDLVQTEWGAVQGFQRVRSTVAIFSLTAMYWHCEAGAGRWVPSLIGLGDVPLHATLEAILSSGLLLGNERRVQGFRSVVSTDITSGDGQTGTAVLLDARLRTRNIETAQPRPVVRLASALLMTSLVPRFQGRMGATKAELLHALFVPDGRTPCRFVAAEEIFNEATGEEGLGAIDRSAPGVTPARYRFSIAQTLNMYFNLAKGSIQPSEVAKAAWERAKDLSVKGPFDEVRIIEQPGPRQSLADVAAGMDVAQTQLLVLDPREWSLMNGVDDPTRVAINRVLGVGPGHLVADYGASSVVAVAGSQGWKKALSASESLLAWRQVEHQVIDDDERRTARSEREKAEISLKNSLLEAFAHYSYLAKSRQGDQFADVVHHARFDAGRGSALSGRDVWHALVSIERAVGKYIDPATNSEARRPLSGIGVGGLLLWFDRSLSLRDFSSSFYRDSRFPLVESAQMIKDAVFELVSDDTGDDGWDLADADGKTLKVEGPNQIALSSMIHQLQRRKRRVSPATSAGGGVVTTAPVQNRGEPGLGVGRVVRETLWHDDPPKEVTYKAYGIDVTNRSITSPDRREEIRKLVTGLGALLDHEDLGLELITIRVSITARDATDIPEMLRSRITAVEGRFTIQDAL